MAFSHTSRKRKTWYLYEGKTKLGKPKYFLSQETTSEKATPLDAVPEGYEVYEKPNGQVFCGKIQPKLITDEEVAVVEKELAKRQLQNCIVERKGKDIIIHEGKGMDLSGGFAQLFGRNPGALAEIEASSRQYQPVMRFRLQDEEKRDFTLCRWCFLGSIDDWFYMAGGKLPDLAKKYIKHIGKESFYEMF